MNSRHRRKLIHAGFTQTDLLASVAIFVLIAAVATAVLSHLRAKSRIAVCSSNLREIGRAILLFSKEHDGKLPGLFHSESGDSWWWYKEQVKGYIGLVGASSSRDTAFSCPDDRGYSDPSPFCKTARFDYNSYVFNGVTLGTPNIAGWNVSTIKQPARTLLVMEWAAHGPLSWHRSRTGKRNAPFYSDAESIVAFVDGHVKNIPIYYDGYNAAYTRDPIAGYEYKYSGN